MLGNSNIVSYFGGTQFKLSYRLSQNGAKKLNWRLCLVLMFLECCEVFKAYVRISLSKNKPTCCAAVNKITKNVQNSLK